MCGHFLTHINRSTDQAIMALFVRRTTATSMRSALQQRLGSTRAKSDIVTLEKHGRVGILRLNDPKRLNPMTAAMGEALQGLSNW